MSTRPGTRPARHRGLGDARGCRRGSRRAADRQGELLRAGAAGCPVHHSDHGRPGPGSAGRRPQTLRAHAAATRSRSRSRSPVVSRLPVGWAPSRMLQASVFMAARCSRPASARSRRAHLFATFPQLAWGTELFGPLLLTEKILTEPLGYGDFALKVPDRPGLGIELDPNRDPLLPSRPRRDTKRTAASGKNPSLTKGMTMLFQVEKTKSACRTTWRPKRRRRVEAGRARAGAAADAGRQVWRYLWRVVGHYSNTPALFDVESHDELHAILTSLPLFPFMTMKVTPLCRHPSSIRDDDT